MKKINSIFLLMMILFLLSITSKTVSATETDNKFELLKDSFIEALWKNNPEWATSLGYHKYDGMLSVSDATTMNAQKQFAIDFLQKLQQFDISKLNDANKIDYNLIKNQLQKTIWQIDEEKAWQWNPSSYNVSDAFASLLYENYAPLEERLQSFAERMKRVPAYYEAAKKNIVNPAIELQMLAINQNEGGVAIFDTDFLDSLQRSSLSNATKATMKKQALAAANAMKDFIDWLNNLHPENPRSFRLGEKLYEQKFNYDIQSEYTAKQLYDFAIARKQFIQAQMTQLTKELWPKYFGESVMPDNDLEAIRMMIDTLSVQHAKPEAFQTEIEHQLPELVAFINQKNILFLDPSKPLVVRKEPAYMAGVAGASISAPGPYNKEGNTYYNVGSLEGWPADKAESYLREYNNYILQILNIHEAIPGHYTQLVYANQSPSIIKSILGNGSMIEGWAVYGEQMMLESGYGNNAPEMWLMWYKWNLRTVCNTILDYSVHTKNMSEQDALKLLTYEAFQQNAEAEGKWKRVSVTSVQLTSYYNGYKEIIDLREVIKNRMGAEFSLKKFNEKFLSYGSAPVKYIKSLMLQ